ncbi:Dihydroorotase [bioreactor metagenome]|uniref:Dihydroorotase n=1 Tax=bioreactor metagenome TaxID=1076179 RepID=A0A645ING9_9ZZZZ
MGLETSFAAGYTNLVLPGYINMERLIGMMAANPAAILNIDKGNLKIDGAADLLILDLTGKRRVEPEKFYSKGKYTPFEGMTLSGVVKYTIVNGKIGYQEL